MARIDQSLVAEAIGLPPEKAIAFFEAKGYKITWNWKEQANAAESQAFTVAKAMRMDILQDIKGAVQKGLDDGVTFREFRKQLEPKLQAKGWWGRKVVEGPNGTEVVQLGSPHRLETIYRTNMQSAYMAGRRQEQVENADERPFLQYIAVVDASTRPEHLAMNGRIFPIFDPIWDKWTPPCGYRCRCRTRALTAEQAERKGGVSKVPEGVTPDPGFGNNPAKKPFQPDMRKYGPEVKEAGAEMEKERPWTPQGTPVGKALKLPGGKLHKALRDAVDAIDAVHGDGDLPAVPVKSSRMTNAYGSYTHRYGFNRKDTPVDIKISSAGDHPGLTFAHETGHFLDNQAMTDRAGWGSESAPELEGFRRAVGASKAITRLKDMLGRGVVEIDEDGLRRTIQVPAQHVKYLLRPWEVWARAYAQYIATRSKNATLLKELDLLRVKKPGYLDLPRQWEEADFAPIQAEMDAYFKAKGWVK